MPISSTEVESSSVAVATDCMLLEASSDAPATWLDRLWVVSAVRVSVPAACFKLNGGSRNVRDDRAHRRLEFVGEADELGAPRRAARLVLGILRRGIALGLGDRLHLELLHRAGHLAEFVLAAEAGQHDVEIAAGEFAHRLAHRRHRPGDSLAQQQRQHPAEQEAAAREHQDQALGLADGRVATRIQVSADRKAGPPSLRPRPCTIAAADSVISATSSSIDFEFSISLVSACRYSSSSAAASLRPCTIFSSFDDIALQRVLDEFEPRQRAGGDRLVGIDDERIGERRHRLELIGDFFRAELDRLKLGVVGVAGEIVELVTQHVAAARQLILRHSALSRLTLRMSAKILVKVRNSRASRVT